MAKRTVIAPDEELLIEGKLTVTGNVTQIESTQTVNRLESDQLVINDDSSAQNAKLILKSTATEGSLTYDGSALVIDVPIQVPPNTTITGTFIGDLTGDVTGQVSDISNHDTGDLAEGSNLYFTTARARGSISHSNVSGDGSISYNSSTGVISYTGPSASEVRAHFSASNGVSYNSGTGAFQAVESEIQHDSLDGFVANEHINHSGVTLTAGGGLTGGGTIVASRTFNVGQGTGITVNADSVQLDDSYARGLISVTDAGGDGSLSYNNSTGVITYTGPSQAEINSRIDNHLTGGDGIDYAAGTIDVDSTVVRTSGAQTIAGNKTFTGTTTVSGHILPSAANTYNLGSWANHFDQVFANVLHAERLDLGNADLTDIHGTFYAGTPTGTILDTNTAGGLIYAHNSPGDTNPGGYYRVNPGDGIQIASDAVAVDSTVIRTTGNQNLAGTKTFTGTIIVPTQAQTDNSTKAASTAYVRTAISDLIDGAPATLDTLNELANALNDDNSIGSIVTNNTSRIGTLEQRNLNAGAGLTGGGNLTADRTFNVGAGNGITVNADSIQTDNSYIRGLFSAGGDLSYNSTSGQFSVTTYKSSDFDTDFAGKSTTNLSEGTNLYYTQSRFDTAFSNKSTTNLSEGTNLYYTDARVDAHLTGGDGIDYTTGTIDVDNTVVRTSGNFTLAGDISYTGELILPINGTAPTNNGSIYHNNIDVFAVINNTAVKLTPQSDVGEIEDVGAGEVNLYAGSRNVALGNANVKYHGVKSVSSGTYTTVSEAANVVTIDGDISAIRGAFSAVDNGGYGSFAYNNGTGAFTYTGIADADIRGLFSGTGLISYNSANGQISTTADNYSSWKFTTASAGNVDIASGDLLTVQGTQGITVTHTGSTITIAGQSGDITGVTAGSGLTGGGNSGAVTLNVGAGYGITVNADTIETNNTNIRALFDASGDLSYNSSTGVVSFTERTDAEVRGLVSASGSLSYNSTTGVFSFTERTDQQVRNLVSASGSLSYNSTTGVFSYTERTDNEIRGLFSVSGDLSYDNTTGVISFTERTDAEVDTLIDNRVTQTFVNNLSIDATLFDGNDSAHYLNAGNLTGTIDSARLPDLTVADFAGAAIQTSAETFSDSDTVLMTAAAIEDRILSKGYTTNVGDITGVTAGTGLSGGGTSGSVTLDVSGLTVSEFAASAIQTSAETFADNDTSLMTSAAIEDRILSKGYSTVDTLKAVNQSGLITLQLDDASGKVDEVLMNPSAHVTITSGGAGLITFGTDGTSANTGGTLVARDGAGNFSAGTITASTFSDGTATLTGGVLTGTATVARYADLAEKYATDVEYEPGTVVVFGGVAEITECTEYNSPRVAGVISTDPAYMMNSEADGQYVALRGRVPCKVVGKVRKGDVLITSNVPGCATASDQPHFVGVACFVGKAITSKDTDGVGIVEIMV